MLPPRNRWTRLAPAAEASPPLVLRGKHRPRPISRSALSRASLGDVPGAVRRP